MIPSFLPVRFVPALMAQIQRQVHMFNGELAGIEKVPTLAQIPVAPVYVPVSPVQQNTVQSVPAAAEPMLQKPETPCAVPVTEQSVKPVQAAR